MTTLRLSFAFIAFAGLIALPSAAEGDRRGTAPAIYYGSAEDIEARRLASFAMVADAGHGVQGFGETLDVLKRDTGDTAGDLEALFTEMDEAGGPASDTPVTL